MFHSFIEYLKFTNIVKNSLILWIKCEKFTIIVNGLIYLQKKKSMLLHPWKEIATRLESLGSTQKAFSLQIWKRVSEINELIKGKRNITLAWDYLLSEYFQTEQKYRIKKQIDYDYEQFLSNQSEKELKTRTSSQEISSWDKGLKKWKISKSNNQKEELKESQDILVTENIQISSAERSLVQYLLLQEIFLNF